MKYLEENIAAFDVKLSKEDLVEIEEAIPHDQVCPVLALLFHAAPHCEHCPC